MTKKPIRQKPVGHVRKAAVARSHPSASEPYQGLVGSIEALLENARRTSARAVNRIMTATYWEIGRRIVEYEQGGRTRAEYGEALLETLSADLTRRVGRGFSLRNVSLMKAFYLAWSAPRVPSAQLPDNQILQTLSAESGQEHTATRFPLPWSAYVRLLAVKNQHVRRFYETAALRDGWSVRQLGRQIDAQFYERTAL